MRQKVEIVLRATCGTCDWTHEGPDADSKAASHSGETRAKSSPRHPTTVEGVPAIRANR